MMRSFGTHGCGGGCSNDHGYSRHLRSWIAVGDEVVVVVALVVFAGRYRLPYRYCRLEWCRKLLELFERGFAAGWRGHSKSSGACLLMVVEIVEEGGVAAAETGDLVFVQAAEALHDQD